MIIPAIDLLDGEAVRLYKGDFSKKTVYSQDPVELAGRFERMGAKALHIVDLNGAKSGRAANLETIRRIRRRVGIPLQVGGGIRDAETVALYLTEINVDRVILGTVAVSNPDFVRECVADYSPERVIVGVDIKEGRVATGGWINDSGVDAFHFIETLKGIGVLTIIVTDIQRDGALTSPNWALYERISGINVIVSGGVACEADLERAGRHYGVIVGKAYYEGRLDLERCLKKESFPAWTS